MKIIVILTMQCNGEKLFFATVREFKMFWETRYLEIYFSRFDSKISNLKKFHTNDQCKKF